MYVTTIKKKIEFFSKRDIYPVKLIDFDVPGVGAVVINHGDTVERIVNDPS